MAGDGHALKHDPAIDRWYQMREEMHTRFRFTGATARKGLFWMVFVPGVLAWFAIRNDTKWDWTAKRKGQSLQSLRSTGNENA